jgi:hypothetical protein
MAQAVVGVPVTERELIKTSLTPLPAENTSKGEVTGLVVVPFPDCPLEFNPQ